MSNVAISINLRIDFHIATHSKRVSAHFFRALDGYLEFQLGIGHG